MVIRGKDAKVRLTKRARAKGLSTLEFEDSMLYDLDIPSSSLYSFTDRHTVRKRRHTSMGTQPVTRSLRIQTLTEPRKWVRI